MRTVLARMLGGRHAVLRVRLINVHATQRSARQQRELEKERAGEHGGQAMQQGQAAHGLVGSTPIA